MNFFEHQQRARQRTWLLAFLFALAAGLTVVLANAVVLAVVALSSADFYLMPSVRQWMGAHPAIFIWTSIGTLGAIGAASMYRMASLSGGGSVAGALGGVPVEGDPADPRRRQLQNVVEEMAIAAGLPAPAVYVLEQEPGINAFAAGFSPSDAAIAVTRGTLEFLTRDELQGVVAHEFSHILNGDMRLNTRLLGVLYGILFIGLAGRTIVRGLAYARGSSRRGGAHVIALVFVSGFALIVIGYFGTFLGAMIRAAVSRQRELLADASAVQFTRNPHGIAGTLKKIAVSPLRTVLQTVDSEEIGHMLIADGRKMFAGFFATHPPIIERIKAIDRRFDPAELERIKLNPVGITVPTAVPKAGAAPSLPISPALVIAAVGSLSDVQLEAAARREAEIPEALVRAAHSRTHAPGLVLALVLSKNAGERARQIDRMRSRLPETLFPHVEAFVSMAAPLDPAHRLPLIEIAFPALRQRSPEELRRLVTVIDELCRADGRYDVLDYALVRRLRVQLGEAAEPRAVAPPAARLHALRDEARILFSVVAHAGSRDRHAAQRAYAEGMQHLFGTPAPPYAPPEPWIASLDRSLTRLDALAPAAKESLIEALAMAILHDRRVTLGEVELLRAICASLHCPLPPLPLTAARADGAEKAGAPPADA